MKWAVAYSFMVLHTCLDEHKVEQLAQPGNTHLALKVMELCRTVRTELDVGTLSGVWLGVGDGLCVREMYTHYINIMLQGDVAGADLCWERRTLRMVSTFLASCFQERCRAVLTLSSESDKEESMIRLIGNVLCEMTSLHKQFMFLQNHPDLKSTVDLLQQVHALGKTSKNVFTADQHFSLDKGGDCSSSPSVSFKAHLIRLKGNLCHRNTTNQNKDTVRELDGLPLIMDNCVIDSNNPCWAIFATRNILDHNLVNQELVVALECCGLADDSSLRAMGLRVKERDGIMLLKPCSKDP
uniref:Ataxin-10 domain-containing protein n=1 Tax=Oncorhynchus kisutch TaxID=8019 RepID=A0A8C7K5Z2_ONCKI